MIKRLSSFSPTFLLRACLILVTICPLLRIHKLKKVARSFAHAPGAPDYQFHVARRYSTLSYGGDVQIQCLLGHVKHLRHRQFALSRNAATSIPGSLTPPWQSAWSPTRHTSPRYASTRNVYRATPEPHAVSMPCYYAVTHARRDRIDGYVSYPYQGALSSLPPNAPLPSSASLNFRVTTGRYIKHCIHYHKTLDFQKLCKTHAYGVQVDQGERTACKVCIPAAKLVPIVSLISICAGPLTRSVCTEPYIHLPSTASSLYPVSHPVTNIDLNQQHSKWR
ncbi:hypothetical protein B0H14DRAFT_3767890 [Mycena olivaceomarginata]|nr:hypothetical protein B0H14DRAFT_3767890 [Mycena olivaceomarginata]